MECQLCNLSPPLIHAEQAIVALVAAFKMKSENRVKVLHLPHAKPVQLAIGAYVLVKAEDEVHEYYLARVHSAQSRESSQSRRILRYYGIDSDHNSGRNLSSGDVDEERPYLIEYVKSAGRNLYDYKYGYSHRQGEDWVRSETIVSAEMPVYALFDRKPNVAVLRSFHELYTRTKAMHNNS